MFSSRRFAAPIVLVLGALLLSSVLLVPSRPAAAATNAPAAGAGRAMINNYCKRHGFARAVLVENTAYGWRCKKASGKLVGIHMGQVCQEAKANRDTPHVVAWFDENSYYNAADIAWACVQLHHKAKVDGKPFGYMGRPNLDTICGDGGEPQLLGDTVADWKCVSDQDPNGYITIDMAQACDRTYNPANNEDFVIPIFNYWDPHSTICWR